MAGDARLVKAHRFLDAARLLERTHPEVSVGRSYYAAYHAAVALLEQRAGGQVGRRWSHGEVQNAVSGLDKRTGITLRGLYRDRLVGDYALNLPNRRRARRNVEIAVRLLTAFTGALQGGRLSI